MTQNTKSSGRKSKPTKQYKQAVADYLVTRGMKNSDAKHAAKVEDDNASGEDVSAAIIEALK